MLSYCTKVLIYLRNKIGFDDILLYRLNKDFSLYFFKFCDSVGEIDLRLGLKVRKELCKSCHS